jgi:hypothetical protein
MKAQFKFSLFLTFICLCFLTQCKPDEQTDSGNKTVTAQKSDADPFIVRKCNDFEITGNGSNPEWNKAEWQPLTKLDTLGKNYKSQFKVMASSTGIYVLFQGEDDKITTENYKNMDRIWNGDVYEVFFHPDPAVVQYFEYEVNALEKQLVLSISRLNNQGVSWIPFNQNEDNYGVKNKAKVVGGAQEINSLIQSWSAEVFLAYKAFGLFQNVPPKSGTIWNANFYRSDYDAGAEAMWSWSPTIGKNYHDLSKYLPIKFE